MTDEEMEVLAERIAKKVRDPIAYDSESLCELLKIKRSRLDQLRKTHQIRAKRVGQSWVYPKNEVQRFLDDD